MMTTTCWMGPDGFADTRWVTCASSKATAASGRTATAAAMRTVRSGPLGRSAMVGGSLLRGKPQGCVVTAGDQAERFDDEVVILALGQAGYGDGADDSGARDDDREAAAMRGVIFLGQVIAGAEGQAGQFEQPADVIRTFVESRDGVDLALHPALIVGRRAGQRAVEELLVRRAE